MKSEHSKLNTMLKAKTVSCNALVQKKDETKISVHKMSSWLKWILKITRKDGTQNTAIAQRLQHKETLLEMYKKEDWFGHVTNMKDEITSQSTSLS